MTTKRLLMAVALLGAPAALPAQQATQSDVHVVDPGDTLWDLADVYLGNPFLWGSIYELNRAVIDNPNLIYPAERIRLPGATAAQASAPVAENGRTAAPVRTAAASPTVFSTRATALGTGPQSGAPIVMQRAASARVAVSAGAFHTASLLVPDTAITRLGRLVEAASATVIPASQASQIQPYDRVYVALEQMATVGDRVQFLRRGREIEPFGRVYQPTASGRIVAVTSGTATVEVDGMYDNLAPGDIAVPLTPFSDLTGAVRIPGTGLDGVVIDVVDPQPVVSREDLVFLNLGTASGVSEGDEFEIYIPETVADWGIRPALDVARVRVVRAELLTSAARVIEMSEPAIAAGLPVRLVGTLAE